MFSLSYTRDKSKKHLSLAISYRAQNLPTLLFYLFWCRLCDKMNPTHILTGPCLELFEGHTHGWYNMNNTLIFLCHKTTRFTESRQHDVALVLFSYCNSSRKTSNVIRTSVTHSAAPRVQVFGSYHNFTSTVIYY